MLKLKQKLNKFVKKAKLKKTAYFKLLSQKISLILERSAKIIEPGGLNRNQVKSLALICSITLTGYVVLFQHYYYKNLAVAPKKYFVAAKPRDMRKENLKKDISFLVKGHPIEMMIPFIAEKDRKVAAYLVGIAKKESNWGEKRPVLAGQDCYNYWGFRAKWDRMGSGGHTCFDSPGEAVAVVSKRIAEIIDRNDVESAKDMLVWKCGSDCSVTGGQAAADKWADDVDLYAEKLLN
jgi:hypothetical protein